MNIYKSNRLQYIPVGDIQHEEFLHSLLTEPGALNFDVSLPTGYTQEQASAAAKALPKRKLLAMYMCISSGGGHQPPRPIGVIALSKAETEKRAHHGTSFLSVSVAARWQRQGYGREAVAWALDWAFDFARLHRVEVSCYSWNPGAERLYVALGFRVEGTRREAVWFMGAWHDVRELAVLEHEWRAVGRARAAAGTWAPGDGRVVTDEEIAEMMGSG